MAFCLLRQTTIDTVWSASSIQNVSENCSECRDD
jgi:hypothetical protein